MALEAGELVGYGACWQVREQKFRIDLMVRPDRQRPGYHRERIEIRLVKTLHPEI